MSDNAGGGSIARHITDICAGTFTGRDWPCCEHCDHVPGYEHMGPCMDCDDQP